MSINLELVREMSPEITMFDRSVGREVKRKTVFVDNARTFLDYVSTAVNYTEDPYNGRELIAAVLIQKLRSVIFSKERDNDKNWKGSVGVSSDELELLADVLVNSRPKGMILSGADNIVAVSNFKEWYKNYRLKDEDTVMPEKQQ